MTHHYIMFCWLLALLFIFSSPYEHCVQASKATKRQYKYDSHAIYLLSNRVKDPINSVLLLNIAANRGSVLAMHNLSKFLFYTFKDYDRALYWIRRAINPIPSDNLIPVPLPHDIALYDRLRMDIRGQVHNSDGYQKFFNDTFIRYKEDALLAAKYQRDIISLPPNIPIPTTPFIDDSTLRPAFYL